MFLPYVLLTHLQVAAQNCRKRKLDQILSLADEVREVRDRKVRLITEHEYILGENKRVKDKYQQLYRHVFQVIKVKIFSI